VLFLVEESPDLTTMPVGPVPFTGAGILVFVRKQDFTTKDTENHGYARSSENFNAASGVQ
jgi:hypothetical protein